nr:MAG TPA: hypothetical protein [Caudoviricetes sp.]
MVKEAFLFSQKLGQLTTPWMAFIYTPPGAEPSSVLYCQNIQSV